MEQEALLVRALKRIDVLLVLASAERGDHKSLCLAASEQRRAVGARQDADLRQDWADGRQVAPVDPAFVVEDVPAHDLGLGVVECFSDFGSGKFRIGAFRRERGHDLGLYGVDGGVSAPVSG